MADIAALVTRRSRQTYGAILKSISSLALASVFLPAAPNDSGLAAKGSLGAGNGLRTTDQPQEFYISLATDNRDQSGLSTLVVAGSNRFMFDCGVVGSVPDGDTAPPDVTALFLTTLDATTAECVDRALSDAATSPIYIWGPPGTREW